MWKIRILEMLQNNPGSKTKYLQSVLRQIERYGEKSVPTANQLRLLSLFWESHQKKKFAEIIG